MSTLAARLAEQRASGLYVPSRRILRAGIPFVGPIFIPRVSTAPIVTPGSSNYTSPGTYSFIVPNFNSLSVDVRGAGGGGGGVEIFDGDFGVVAHAGSNGTAGGQSYFGSVIGNGGGGGTKGNGTVYTFSGNPWSFSDGSAGAAGTASGGTTNTTGGGSSGGAGAVEGTYSAGACNGGPGGAGGRSLRTYTIGELTVGASITVVVGTRGSPGVMDPALNGSQAGYGAHGAVYISWS